MFRKIGLLIVSTLLLAGVLLASVTPAIAAEPETAAAQAAVNYIIEDESGTSKLAGTDYYWFFVGLMALVGVAFIFFARVYPEHNYIQGDEAETDSGPSGEPAPTTT